MLTSTHCCAALPNSKFVVGSETWRQSCICLSSTLSVFSSSSCQPFLTQSVGDDLDAKIDLLNAMADSYTLLPDKRLSVLCDLAKLHVQKGQRAEAGECYLHAAALMAEFLAMLGELPKQVAGCAAFEAISPNVVQESALSPDIHFPEEVVRCLDDLADVCSL